MQIQKVNSQQNPNFGTAVTIKTGNLETAKKLMSLGTLLQEQAKPQFRYLHLGIETGPKGLFKGIIGDREHGELIQGFQVMSLWNNLRMKTAQFIERTVTEEGNKPVIITSIEQILDLPMFANCRDAISTMIAGLK